MRVDITSLKINLLWNLNNRFPYGSVVTLSLIPRFTHEQF